MSRLLLLKENEEKVQGLLDLLKSAEKQSSGDTVGLKKSSIHELVGFVELVLKEKPIVLEEDLSPAEAGEIANISRPTIMHLLEQGVLRGYPVKSQWRIKRDSLLKYIEERESFGASMAEMDKAGFGIDE